MHFLSTRPFQSAAEQPVAPALLRARARDSRLPTRVWKVRESKMLVSLQFALEAELSRIQLAAQMS
jgi:hypothetical protein